MDTIRELCQKGYSDTQIARQMNLSYDKVFYLRNKKLKIKTRGRIKNTVIYLAKKGKNDSEIAESLTIPKYRVRVILSKKGLIKTAKKTPILEITNKKIEILKELIEGFRTAEELNKILKMSDSSARRYIIELRLNNNIPIKRLNFKRMSYYYFPHNSGKLLDYLYEKYPRNNFPKNLLRRE